MFYGFVPGTRLELTQACAHYHLKVACLPIPPPGQTLSEKRDSNPRPRPWQGRALPTELLSHDCIFVLATFRKRMQK